MKGTHLNKMPQNCVHDLVEQINAVANGAQIAGDLEVDMDEARSDDEQRRRHHEIAEVRDAVVGI